jgi:hypothetical protein
MGGEVAVSLLIRRRVRKATTPYLTFSLTNSKKPAVAGFSRV